MMNNTELAKDLRARNWRLWNKAADALEAAQVAASKQATDNNKIVDLIAKQRGNK